MSELHQKILIIYNPAAGKGKGAKYAAALEKRLRTKFGISAASVCGPKTFDDMREFHRANAGNKQNFSMIVIIGGDGTVGPNMDAMIKNDVHVPIFALGRGTANDFSTFFGTKVSTRRAAKIIAKARVMTADTLKIDVTNNQLGVHYAISDAAGGAFTNGVTRYRGKRVFGKLAYVFQAGGHALRMKSQKVRFSVDKDSFETDVFLFYILNTKNVGGIKGAGALANPDDGVLDLVCIRKCWLGARIRVGISALMGRIHKNKHVIYKQGKEFRVEIVGEPIKDFAKTDTDGNIGGDYPLKVTVGPKIQVIFGKFAKNR